MSEGMEIAFDPEVEDLVYRLLASEERLVGLVRTMDRARDDRVRVLWRLIERLVALEAERPSVRWWVGDTAYWSEGRLLRSVPIPADAQKAGAGGVSPAPAATIRNQSLSSQRRSK